jgi:hypothetical protein
MYFLFSVIIKSENRKISFTFLQSYKNTKTPLFTLLVYFLQLQSVILFYQLYLFQNLVLDNHSMELGMQDKEFVLQVASRERRELFRMFPESSIFTPSHPCGKNYSCYNTLHLKSQRSGTLLSVIKTIF